MLFRPSPQTKSLRIYLPPVNAGLRGRGLRRLVHLGGVTCPPDGGTPLCPTHCITADIYGDIRTPLLPISSHWGQGVNYPVGPW